MFVRKRVIPLFLYFEKQQIARLEVLKEKKAADPDWLGFDSFSLDGFSAVPFVLCVCC